MDFALNTGVDKVIFDSLYESTSFREFCSDLDQLGTLFDETMYLEKVEQKSYGLKKDVGKVYSNTRDSVKAAGDIYRYSTDAGGGFFASLWKLAASAAKLAARAAKWIFTHIDKIPLYAAKVIDGIADIPANVKNKIKGNIKLYITADDIVNVYSITASKNDNALFARLERIIRELKELRKGEMWTTYWTNKTSPGEFFKQFAKEFMEGRHKTDIDRIHRINDEFKSINNVKFSKTVIEMNDPNIVEIYFGTGKIKYTDPRGVKKEGNYLECLKAMMEYISSLKEEFKLLNDDIGSKFITTETNAEFANMDKFAQKTIVKFMETMGKLTEIIGNITRYAMEDIKTIEKSVNQIKASTTLDKAGKLEDKVGDDAETETDKRVRKTQVAEYYAKHPIKKLMRAKKNKEIEEAKQELKDSGKDYRMIYDFTRSDIKDMTDKKLEELKTNMEYNIKLAEANVSNPWNSEEWVTFPTKETSECTCMVKEFVRSSRDVIDMVKKEQEWRKNGKG